MPRKNSKQQVQDNHSTGSQSPVAHAARKNGKTAGTRVGVLDDWRAGGAKGTGKKSALGKQLRDGR
jgi:hypothetical protein